MSDTRLPYRAITAVLVCLLVAFGIAFGTGALEIHRPAKPAPPPPEPEPTSPYVQRDRAAEILYETQPKDATREGLRDEYNTWVYKFGGGIPICWAEIESEGHKQTLGDRNTRKQPAFIANDPSDSPVLETVEGYVALFGPTSKEQNYLLVYGFTKVDFPTKSAPDKFRSVFTRQPQTVTLPNLLPTVVRPAGRTVGFSDSGRHHDGDKRCIVPVGQDEEVASLNYGTSSGGSCTVRLFLRFLTAEEIAAKR